MNVRRFAMIGRRTFLTGSAGLAAVLLSGGRPARAQAKLGDDGIYQQPWFLESLLELPDDLGASTAQGKRFAILWELRGCPFCRDIHLINFAKPEIVDYVKTRFDILQLNIIGSREVVDFDGEKLSEKKLAAKYGVRATPTFQFFAERSDDIAARNPSGREVLRAQGYLVPDEFLGMFRFVADRAYERESPPAYLRAGKSSSAASP
jgi:thioredoxin-related protein